MHQGEDNHSLDDDIAGMNMQEKIAFITDHFRTFSIPISHESVLDIERHIDLSVFYKTEMQNPTSSRPKTVRHPAGPQHVYRVALQHYLEPFVDASKVDKATTLVALCAYYEKLMKRE